MKESTPQSRWRERNKNKLAEKNRIAMRARRANPEHREALIASQRRSHFRRNYGMELADVEALWLRANKRCMICGTEREAPHNTAVPRGQRLVIDHCHVTGKVRGVICTGCNISLGKLGDTEVAIQKVLDYLRGV